MVSVLLTACGTDKKIEKQANNIVDAVENNDISELDLSLMELMNLQRMKNLQISLRQIPNKEMV